MNPLIGKPVDRVDGRLKVMGSAKYASDYVVPNLAHAVIFESRIAKGKIKSFDLSLARQVAGLIEIITYENAPKLKKPDSSKSGGGIGEKSLPLSDNEIRYNGQFIGVAIAETLEGAEQAARLVKVQYDEAPAALDFMGLQNKSYMISKMEGMGNINADRGDSQKGLKNSYATISETYTTPIEHHNPMEPSATTVLWKGEDLIVYDANQGVSSMADTLKRAAGVKELQVISKFIGGGFGCKGSAWNHQMLALMAAKQTGRNIKLSLSRSQMFTGVGHRAATVQKISLGADKDGRLLAVEHTITNNTATDKEYSERSAVSTRMLYACENLKAEHRLLPLNYQVPTFMRAPGECSGSAALESAMDELAIRLRMDPIELRLKNYAEKDPQAKKPFSSKSLRECYQKGAERFGWTRRSSETRARREGDEWVGYGMATATYPANRFATKAHVELSRDGKVKVRSGTQDIGTGSWTIFTQIPADAFGIAMSDIDLDIGDSNFPKGGVSGGSSTASSCGSAIQRACDKIKKELIELAVDDKDSPLYKASTKEIEVKNGKLVHAKDPSKSEGFTSALQRSKKPKLEADGETKNERGETEDCSTHAFGAQFVEVRVHAYTGKVRVTQMTGAFAAGRILNAKMAESQYMGGMIFGLGQALMEETKPDLATGRLVVRDLADYHVPVNADVPNIEIVMVEEEDPYVNPLGTKGIGEIGIVGMAAAIANAVYNATGVRVREFPLTPDKIVMGLKELEARS